MCSGLLRCDPTSRGPRSWSAHNELNWLIHSTWFMLNATSESVCVCSAGFVHLCNHCERRFKLFLHLRVSVSHTMNNQMRLKNNLCDCFLFICYAALQSQPICQTNPQILMRELQKCVASHHRPSPVFRLSGDWWPLRTRGLSGTAAASQSAWAPGQLVLSPADLSKVQVCYVG